MLRIIKPNDLYHRYKDKYVIVYVALEYLGTVNKKVPWAPVAGLSVPCLHPSLHPFFPLRFCPFSFWFMLVFLPHTFFFFFFSFSQASFPPSVVLSCLVSPAYSLFRISSVLSISSACQDSGFACWKSWKYHNCWNSFSSLVSSAGHSV